MSYMKMPRIINHKEPNKAVTYLLREYTALSRMKNRPEIDGMITRLVAPMNCMNTRQVLALIEPIQSHICQDHVNDARMLKIGRPSRSMATTI